MLFPFVLELNRLVLMILDDRFPRQQAKPVQGMSVDIKELLTEVNRDVTCRVAAQMEMANL